MSPRPPQREGGNGWWSRDVTVDESLAFGSTSTDDTVRQETSSESPPSPPDTGPTVPSPPQ